MASVASMNPRLPLYLFAYKIACLLAGAACVYMGYKLFLAGVFDTATLEASRGQATLSLQNAAPGTFFALFGTVVIGFTVFRGLQFDASQDAQDKSSEKFKQDATSAKQHWQRV